MKSLERNFNNISAKNPYLSSYMCFAEAVEGRRFSKKIIAFWFNKLVDKGNTIIVIEHNLDVIKMADYIIDMGPEGGKGGGHLLCCGTPEEVAKCDKGYTPKFLKNELEYEYENK